MEECDLTPNTSDKNTPLCCHRENIQHSQVKQCSVISENTLWELRLWGRGYTITTPHRRNSHYAVTYMRNKNCTHPFVEIVIPKGSTILSFKSNPNFENGTLFKGVTACISSLPLVCVTKPALWRRPWRKLPNSGSRSFSQKSLDRMYTALVSVINHTKF